jgi:hypothetical protein
MAVVQAAKVPAELDNWRVINPRDANPRDYVSKKIRESILEDPKMFLFRNRGLVVVCKSFKYDEKKGDPNVQAVITLLMDDPEHHGLLDGGHSFDRIMAALQETEDGELDGLYLKLEVLTGFENTEQIRSVSEGRNTSIQVKEEGLLNIQHGFDGIKEALKGQPYENLISYSEFELNEEDGKPKPVPIRDILSCLMCFDTVAYCDDTGKHPYLAYSGGTKQPIRYFKSNQAQLEPLYPLLPDILKLYDTIYIQMPEIYRREGGEGGSKGHFGKLRSIGNKPEELYFIGAQSRYFIPKPYIMPVFAAFRILVKRGRTKCTWTDKDPFEVFSRIGGMLVRKVGERARSNGDSLLDMGRDVSFWENIYMTFAKYC